jgi:polar amino acid transport system substrate-binding protein
MNKKIITTIFLALVFMGLATSTLATEAPVLKRVLESGQLRVGMTGDQPPMNVRSRTGTFIGLDVDLAFLHSIVRLQPHAQP